jgi:hypothetical protein
MRRCSGVAQWRGRSHSRGWPAGVDRGRTGWSQRKTPSHKRKTQAQGRETVVGSEVAGERMTDTMIGGRRWSAAASLFIVSSTSDTIEPPRLLPPPKMTAPHRLLFLVFILRNRCH